MRTRTLLKRGTIGVMAVTSTKPARDAREGSEIGGYRLGAPLGSGGMGVVYRATDLGTGKEVALKLLRADLADSEERRRRLLREARLAATLSHPGIVRILEVSDKGGTIFVVMELVAGRTLRAFLADAPPLAEALRVARQVATALVHAHEKGIVHRDLKPDNVMVADDGSVRVLDFGLAKLREVEGGALYQAETESNLTRDGGVLGTPGYMAPEQASGKEVSFAADVFSFGSLLYELVTGAKAFTGDSPMDVIVAVTRDTPPRPREKNAAVSPALDDLVMHCLEKAPADRPTMAVVAATLARPAMLAKGGRPRAWIAIVVAVLCIPAVVLLRRAREVKPEPAAAASATPAIVPTALTDLPLPTSPVPAALAAYTKAIRDERDGAEDAAFVDFETATKLDPELAAAHLRFALRVALYEATSGREHYALARKYRDRLSPRDAELLDAAEPLFQRDPSDMPEWGRRIDALSAKYPGDADLASKSATIHNALGEFAVAASQAERAARLDPRFGLALADLAENYAYLGDFARSTATIAKCLAVAPSASQCMWLQEFIDDQNGNCAATEASARQRIAIDPTLSDGYKALAYALAAEGRPMPAVREAVGQTVSRLTDEFGKQRYRLNLLARLAIIEGDFATATKLGDELRALVESRADASDHAAAAYLASGIEQEVGRPERAAEIARAFLERHEAWQDDTIVHDYSMSGDLTPAILTFVRGTKGFPDAAYDEALAAWRKRYSSSARGDYRRYVWVYGYAAAVVTREDALGAVAVLPEYSPLPDFLPNGALPRASVGRTLWLAGREEEGIKWLEQASISCNIANRPLEWIRAHAWLAEALEKSGDKKGACAAHDVVLAHWGNAKPRSITADWSKARARSLGCERP